MAPNHPLDPYDIPFIHLRRAPDGRVRLVEGVADQQWMDHLHGGSRTDRRGEFLRWSFDPKEGRAVVENSRYGMFPCYIHQSPTDFIASPSIVPVVERLSDLSFDDDAMSLLVRSASLVGDLTPFNEVRAMLPSSRVEWSKDGTRVERAPRRPVIDTLSRTAAMDGFNDRFRAAMKARKVDGNFILPLTGGRDSRHILFELLQGGIKPTLCLTRTGRRDAGGDGAVATHLCETFGLPHDVEFLSRPTARVTRDKNLATSFVIPDQHLVVTEVARALIERGQPVYDGIGGDVMIQGNWLTEERWRWWQRQDLDRLIDDFLIPEEQVSRMLSREARDRWSRERARACLRTEFEGYVDEPNPLSAYAFANYTRRGVGSYTFGLLALRIPVACPYLDLDLHEFLASLPAELFLDGTFHTDSIARAYPNWCDIPYERKGVRERWSWDNRHFAGVAMVQALLHARGPLRTAGVLRVGLPRLLKGDFRWNAPFFLGQLFGFARERGLRWT